jgi:hypothetical protein
MRATQTQPARTHKAQDDVISCTFDGYDELDARDFAGLTRAWGSLLARVTVDAGNFAAAYMLATTTTAFIIETMDKRYFVAREA